MEVGFPFFGCCVLQRMRITLMSLGEFSPLWRQSWKEENQCSKKSIRLVNSKTGRRWKNMINKEFWEYKNSNWKTFEISSHHMRSFQIEIEIEIYY